MTPRLHQQFTLGHSIQSCWNLSCLLDSQYTLTHQYLCHHCPLWPFHSLIPSVYFLSRLVEYDPNIQEEVSKTPPLINKFLFTINRCQWEPAGYSLYSSQVAPDMPFYSTFNQCQICPAIGGLWALEQMLTITQKLLIDKDSDAPLRWQIYCTIKQLVTS